MANTRKGKDTGTNMTTFEIKNGLSTKEFELTITDDNEYYLTVCVYGDFYDKYFEDENAVREYLKTEWNFLDEQINRLFNMAVKNGQETIPDLTLDIDEQMHEQQDRDAEYAEAYAEWAESCYPY